MTGDEMRFPQVALGYVNAIRYQSASNPVQAIRSLYQIFEARLRCGIGPRNFALFELADRHPSSWCDYVIEFSSFRRSLVRLTPPSVHAIADDKALFYKFCRDKLLPTIPVTCVVLSSGSAVYRSVTTVMDTDGWRTALSQSPDRLFAKPVGGVFGKGAFSIERVGAGYKIDGKVGSVDNAFQYVVGRLNGTRGYIVQPRIQSHSSIADISASNGLSTIRIVTCNRNGSVKVLFALMKITVGQNVTDNFHHGLSRNLVAAIELESGRLASAIGSLRAEWPVMAEFTHHPETRNRIQGFTVPRWHEAIGLVQRAHEALPLLCSTGWDVAITEEGPLLVETNPGYSFDIMQVAHRRGLKREIMHAVGLI